jgi:hypothetical protein
MMKGIKFNFIVKKTYLLTIKSWHDICRTYKGVCMQQIFYHIFCVLQNVTYEWINLPYSKSVLDEDCEGIRLHNIWSFLHFQKSTLTLLLKLAKNNVINYKYLHENK